MKFFDTIAAIATPIGKGGIAIIRISGGDAEKIAAKVAEPKNKKTLFELETHKLTLCDIHRAERKDERLDTALVAVMRAPHSYTGETVVEINCHGGSFAARAILRELLDAGARPAEPGEFTRRAFINGKTDMAGAEAVMDIIEADSSLGLKNAANTLGGALSEKINALRSELTDIAAAVAAAADYPDEVEPLPRAELAARLGAVRSDISNLIDGFETGKLLRGGIATAIVGKPNVGKSSLLNALTGEERAIVTDIPGTTRDTIEEYISVHGAALRLLDTAGIRAEASDAVEEIGIRRSLESIKNADLCLFVADSSEPPSDEDKRIIEALRGKVSLCVLNKTDKAADLTRKDLMRKDLMRKELTDAGFCGDDMIETSLKKGEAPQGIKKLTDKIAEKFELGKIKSSDVFVTSARQRDSLVKARAALDAAIGGLDMPYDLLYIDMEDALTALGEVTGLTVSDEIIDRVFERFCVGK